MIILTLRCKHLPVINHKLNSVNEFYAPLIKPRNLKEIEANGLFY